MTHTQLAYKTFPRLCSLKAENLSSLLCIGLASCRAIGPVSVGDWWFSHSFLATNFPTSCVTKLSFSNRNRVGVTAWSSWLPNQMISLIWIFGFLCRSSISIPRWLEKYSTAMCYKHTRSSAPGICRWWRRMGRSRRWSSVNFWPVNMIWSSTR